MGKGPRWTLEEDEFLTECVKSGKDEFQISQEFHARTKMNIKSYHYRSADAIKRRIYDLPIEQARDETKPAMHRKRWLREDDDLLLHLESIGMTKEDIAERFNRTESAIESRLQVLKSKDNGSFMDSFKESLDRITSLFRRPERGK